MLIKYRYKFVWLNSKFLDARDLVPQWSQGCVWPKRLGLNFVT